jgi:nicotinamidase-related amidase
MHPLPQNAALVIIDVQAGFDDPAFGPRNNPQAEENIARLLDAWRRAGRPIFHVQHLSTQPNSPLRPGQPGCEIKAIVRPLPGEPLIQKRVHSAFIGTDLEEQLRQGSLDTLVITGLTTNHCVSTTARMANNLGFTTYVVADATATFDRAGHDGRLHKAEDVHAIALASLHEEFATVVEADSLLGQLE